MENETKCTVEKTQTELENINSQLSELNNFAVDINMRIMQFNDRVNGCVPREAVKGSENNNDNSLLNGIKETVDCLRGALHQISSEASRLDEIG